MGLQGRRRSLEIAREAEVERRQIEAKWIEDLGHAPSAAELAAIEAASSAQVRARRLRRNGRDDSEQIRLIARLLRAAGIQQGAPQPTETWAERVQRLGREQAHTAALPEGGHSPADRQTRTSEAGSGPSEAVSGD